MMMKFTQEHQAGIVTLSQKQYIKCILKKHQLINAKLVSTLMDPNSALLKQMEAPNTNASNLYAAAVGSSMYTAIGTQPNIVLTVQSLSQFTQNPVPEHWITLNIVFSTNRAPKI